MKGNTENNMEAPYDPAILLLGIYGKEMKSLFKQIAAPLY